MTCRESRYLRRNVNVLRIVPLRRRGVWTARQATHISIWVESCTYVIRVLHYAPSGVSRNLRVCGRSCSIVLRVSTLRSGFHRTVSAVFTTFRRVSDTRTPTRLRRQYDARAVANRVLAFRKSQQQQTYNSVESFARSRRGKRRNV